MKETMLTYILKEEKTNRYILENHETLLQPFYDWLQECHVKRWVILATGSSANAVSCAKPYIEQAAHVQIDLRMPSEFARYPGEQMEDEVYIAVSQSGHSASTLQAIQKVKRKERLFIISADTASPVMQEEGGKLLLACGEEIVDLVTMGMSATILMLLLMGMKAAYTGGYIQENDWKNELTKLSAVINSIPDTIARCAAFIKQHAVELNSMKRTEIIGYSSCYGVAKEAETKMTETLYIPAHGYEMEEYMHGPYLALHEDTYFFMLKTAHLELSNRMQNLCDYLKRYNHHIFILTDQEHEEGDDVLYLSKVDEGYAPLLYVIFFQYLCDYLTKYKGYDPMETRYDDFDDVLASKI